MSHYGSHRQSMLPSSSRSNNSNNNNNQTASYTRQSLAPSAYTSHSHPSTSHTQSTTQSRLSTLPTSASKQRQLSHLNSQLAQLTAHMSDLENLLRMTAVQAEGMRGLGGYAGGMFMAASKVLGEEAVKNENKER